MTTKISAPKARRPAAPRPRARAESREERYDGGPINMMFRSTPAPMPHPAANSIRPNTPLESAISMANGALGDIESSINQLRSRLSQTVLRPIPAAPPTPATAEPAAAPPSACVTSIRDLERRANRLNRELAEVLENLDA